jgi:hypothetical protein
MACRDEHPTRHNRASFLRIQHALSNISEYWVRYRIRRVLRLQYMKMKRKVRAWKRDMITFRHNCRELLRKYKADSNSVTVGDWDKITAGKERRSKSSMANTTPESSGRTMYLGSTSSPMRSIALHMQLARSNARSKRHARQRFLIRELTPLPKQLTQPQRRPKHWRKRRMTSTLFPGATQSPWKLYSRRTNTKTSRWKGS